MDEIGEVQLIYLRLALGVAFLLPWQTGWLLGRLWATMAMELVASVTTVVALL
jgi:hypothetical protein